MEVLLHMFGEMCCLQTGTALKYFAAQSSRMKHKMFWQLSLMWVRIDGRFKICGHCFLWFLNVSYSFTQCSGQQALILRPRMNYQGMLA